MTRTTEMKRRMAKSPRQLRVEGWANVAGCHRVRPCGIIMCLMISRVITSYVCVNLMGLGGVQALAFKKCLTVWSKGLIEDMWKSTGGRGGSCRTHVIPKNSEKCSFIFNSMKMNNLDSHTPPCFVLPYLKSCEIVCC